MYVFAISVRKYFCWFYFHEFIREIWKKDIKFRNSSILSFKFLCKKKKALNALIFLEIIYSVCKFFAN